MVDGLYPPTRIIASMLTGRFVNVEAHDISDSESPDLLWLESTPDDALSEGKVLTINPATDDQTSWYAALDSAHKFGGWSTSWSIIGSPEKIVVEIQKALGGAHQ